MNLWSFLEARVRLTPEKVLLRYDTTHELYEAFYESAVTAADVLHGLGVRRGEPVCLILNNSSDYLHIWFGLARLGAVTVPVNVHLKGDGLTYVLRHSRAKIAIVEEGLLERITGLEGSLPSLEAIVVRGEDPAGACPSWSVLTASASPISASADVDATAVSSILYTSGTTGVPKGVMLSHHAYLSSARFFAEHMVGASSDDVFYTCLPLFHINAQAHTALAALQQNATMAIGSRFSASRFWDEIRGHGATIFNSLGAMIPILCKQPPSPGDRRHQARITACAATPKNTWLEFEARFGVRIVEGYGLTETAGFCVSNPLPHARVGSVGKAMGLVDVRVVDADDRELPAERPGEVAIRAREPHVLMEGYFDMPGETAEAMRGGWFHSGDIGRFDDDGYLYFVDRLKQVIRRRGENISSLGVEDVVNAHPDVLESAAVGVPSELGEEEVMICVVLRPGRVLQPLEVVRWCEERMAYFMVPRYVLFRDALPKTPTERVEKYKLKGEGTAAAWDREAAGYAVHRS